MKKVFISLLIKLVALSCLAQNPQTQLSLGEHIKPVDILSPSPNAASLGRYGGMDIGLSTGMMSFSVPLIFYKSAQISLPISLNYASTGLKVDEISSRVGTSWDLNAGGVITRTVYGAVDEKSRRIIPPANFPARTRDLIDNFLENLTMDDNAWDGQADVFSFNFNGYTGKFIFDIKGYISTLEHSNLKIEKDFLSSQWNFKITVPNGEQYYFGGSMATETTSKSQTINCGRIYPDFTPTAWYLNKIVHPNNDTITFKYINDGFNYVTGISQSLIYKPALQGTSNCVCTNIENKTCISSLYTSNVLLQEIYSISGGRVRFNYIPRNDIDDKLLEFIELYQPNTGTLLKKIDLLYTYSYANSYLNPIISNNALRYRPFLKEIVQKGSANTTGEKYKFSYKDLNGLPQRLSFSQDDYGNFNGKVNSTLVPIPNEGWKQYFSSATANRNPDAQFASKGMLTGIIYPTGGSDSIVYEANSVYKLVDILPPITTAEVFINAPDEVGEIIISGPITVAYQQSAQFSADCRKTGPEDIIHDKAVISVFDENSVIIFTRTITPQSPLNELLTLYPNKTYRIRVIASRSISARSTLSYYLGNKTTEYVNYPVSGIRVSKIITQSGNAMENINIKKFNYSTLANQHISSGTEMASSGYEKIINSLVTCIGFPCNTKECTYYALYSNSINNINAFPTPVYYNSVIESFGENYENGGIEHHYNVVADVLGNNLIGDNVIGAPRTSYSYINGKEIYQHVFKWTNNTPVSVKKIFTHYKEDPRVNNEYQNYIVSKKYNALCENDPPTYDETNAYDLTAYSHFSKWVYVDSLKTFSYDQGGQNYIEELTLNEYANKDHAFLTKVVTTTSNAISNEITNSYPYDIILSGAEENARQALISHHIISPVIIQQVKKNAAVQKFITKYAIFSNGLVLPETHTLQVGSSIEDRVHFKKYNNYGKLLSQSLSSGPTISYDWKYNSLYMVAECRNASEKEFYYESFEENSYTSPGLAHTGFKSSTNTVVNWVRPNIRAYLISYWYRESGVWKLRLEQNYTADSFVLAGGDAYDDIRIHPKDAQMTTYTYSPLIGMTSQTDPKGQTTYYEYDSFQRLKNIKDQNGNIIKSYTYNYKQ